MKRILREDGGIVDLWGLSEFEHFDSLFRKPIYSFDFAPFDPRRERVEDRPDLFFAFGYFYLMYCHRVVDLSTGYEGKMFRICAGDASIRQLMRNGDFESRIRDWDDFVEQAKTNKSYNFLLRASTISKELFDLARRNYAVRLAFTIDSVKYEKLVGQPTSLASLKDMMVLISRRSRRNNQERIETQ